VTLWHVCGTPEWPLVTTSSDQPSLGALTRDFVGAPSRIRTCDLLLRRHSRDVPRHGCMPPDVGFSSPRMAECGLKGRCTCGRWLPFGSLRHP
jgi:hypothetical protein